MPSTKHCGGFLLCRKRGDFMGEELVRNIYERLGGIEAKIDDVRDIRITADKADDKADEALQSTRSAHKRLDKIDKTIWWVTTTIIGTVLLALLAMVLKTN
ncbi:hemolysin XhlA family protein [Viridibacillus sp. NPDC096237]|uniref:hemolysin XhlA family protein n=1 Tax=Viridibacillus sp. NPDC096237 TaxID=3390721 RepID=UPI003CFC8DE1